MSKFSVLSQLQWKGSNKTYAVPWLRNRIEFSADPERVKEYVKGGGFTRSQLTRDMLTRFHLSNNSIVVSDDEHANVLRKLFRDKAPDRDSYPRIARELVDELIASAETLPSSDSHSLSVSSSLIRENYLSILKNLLGADLSPELVDAIRDTKFHPGIRPVHLEGVMFAFGLQLPGFAPMRKVVDLLFFKGEHYTRNIAQKFEKLVCKHATPKPGSWYATLLTLRQNKALTEAQFKGEITSMLVSSFSLSAAMSSLLLCIAARSEYLEKIRTDQNVARYFVSEVLRLYPPFRRFGYEEKGIWTRKPRDKESATDFMVSVADLHRHEGVWTDPEQFRPERFAVPRAASGCKYMPFGLGPRSCIGQLYSMQMMIEMLKYITSENFGYKFTLPDNYSGDAEGLPIGISGRLISFPVDDRILVEKVIQVSATQQADPQSHCEFA